MSKSASSPRSLELDVLRGIAVVMVLGRHILWVPSWEHAGLLDRFFLAWRHFGWAGVDLFFVLSGFLVGGLLLRETQRNGVVRPGTFLVRRGLKIYPAFYFFIFLSPVIARAAGLALDNWPRGLYYEVFFIQNYFPGLWTQTWSLAVEEHFYLLLLALFLWLTRRGGASEPLRSLPAIVLAVNLLILVGRIVAVLAFHPTWNSMFSLTHWRLDSLFFGVLLSYGYHFHRAWLSEQRLRLRPWRALLLPILLVPPLWLDCRTDAYVYTVGFTTLYLGFGWILLEAVLGASPRHARFFKSLSLLAPIGRASYSTYLWHVLVYYVVVTFIRAHAPGAPFVVDAVAYMIAAAAVGGATYAALELPVLALRDRLIPSKIRPMEPQSAVS